MRNQLKIILATVLATTTLPLAAQDNTTAPQGGQQMMLNALDSNGDGSISLEEFTGSNAPMLARIDANNDGFVSEEEFLTNFRNMGTMAGAMRQGGGGAAAGGGRGQNLTDAQRAQLRERMEQQARGRFAAMDQDGDQKVSLAEHRRSTFNTMDRNQDGMLSGDELNMQGMGAMRGGRGRNQ